MAGAARWLKGSTHVHARPSGDSTTPIPEVIAWYEARGYDFIVLTDHNQVSELPGGGSTFGEVAVRAPAQGLVVLAGIELTHNPATCLPPPPLPDGKCRIHVNALGVTARPEGKLEWAERKSTRRLDQYGRALSAARELGGLAQINHPQWHWGMSAELLTELARRGAVLVEIANSQFTAWNDGSAGPPPPPPPSSSLPSPSASGGARAAAQAASGAPAAGEASPGGAGASRRLSGAAGAGGAPSASPSTAPSASPSTAPSTASPAAPSFPSVEALWDAALGAGVTLWGVAADDAHSYDGKGKYPAGGAWIMVEAPREPRAILSAIEAGAFYASTGVVLARAGREGDALVVEVAAQSPGRHRIELIENGARVAELVGRSARRSLPARGYLRAVVTRDDGARAWVQPARRQAPPATGRPSTW